MNLICSSKKKPNFGSLINMFLTKWHNIIGRSEWLHTEMRLGYMEKLAVS